jgi:hypothetical protein
MLGIDQGDRGFATLGLSALLYVAMNEAGRRRGVEWGELSWTLETTTPSTRGSPRPGAVRYKTYRVYEKVSAHEGLPDRRHGLPGLARAEALCQAGHDVTALARNPAALHPEIAPLPAAPRAGLTLVRGSLFDARPCARVRRARGRRARRRPHPGAHARRTTAR